jgi:outer membrane protein OmpA-like peptidoglycan-associated protein
VNMNKLIKYISVLFLFFFIQEARAQLLLPNFEPPRSLRTLNTESEEIAPIPFSNGEKLYFVRCSPEGNAKERKAGQEILTAERIGDSWSEPKNIFKEANDLGNNGVIGSSADGNKIYVFNSLQSRRKLARGIAYLEKQEDGTWSDLKKLKIGGFEIGDGYYSFYMNRTEDVLLISMAPNGKTLNEDLFVSLKDSLGNWTQVQGLGSKINTTGVELSPFITEDKNALYFASNGHGGEGDVDVFVTYRLGDGWNDWTTPKNLGPQINSAFFDAYFMIGNNKEVFFVSNRDSAMGDVYTTKIIESKTVQMASNEVNGQFLYKGLPTENVRIEVYDVFGDSVETIITDEFGKFSYQKLNPDETYFLRVSASDAAGYPDAVLYEFDEQGRKLNRYSLTGTGIFINTNQNFADENIVGTFTYNDLPLENSYLLVYDESGNPVDTIITDGQGNFVYKKLDPEGAYTFKPLSLSDSDDVLIEFEEPNQEVLGSFTYKSLPLQNEALLVFNQNGDVVDTIYTDTRGKFRFKKLKADENYSFKALNIEDSNELLVDIFKPEAVVKGNFTYKSLPLQNEALLVFNERGDIIDTIYTDIRGNFNYKKLKGDANYSFKPVDLREDALAFDYVVEEPSENKIKGTLQFNKLPLLNTPLLVKDENGFVVDTIYTDFEGKFSYKKLKPDSEYSFEVLEQNDNTGLVDFDLISIEKETVKGSFAYKNLPLKNEALVVLDENGFAVDTIYTDENGSFQYSKLKGDTNFKIKLLNDEDIDNDLLVMNFRDKETEKQPNQEELKNKKLSGEALKPLVVYFDFNEMVLSEDDYSILNKVVNLQFSYNSIIIEGHTDDVGTHKQNRIVANARVDVAFEYLIKKGVNPTKIVRHPIGESMPTANNGTVGGRAKNRRLMLILK